MLCMMQHDLAYLQLTGSVSVFDSVPAKAGGWAWLKAWPGLAWLQESRLKQLAVQFMRPLVAGTSAHC